MRNRGVAGAAEPVTVALKPQWEDPAAPVQPAAMPSFSDRCTVTGLQDTVRLAFSGPPESPASAAQHVLLTPFGAKRLLQTLEQGLDEYAQRFGAAEAGPHSGTVKPT